MNIDLKGRHAVVTGGASNIGRGFTLELADSDANVIILDENVEQAKRTADLRPGRISVCGCDLSDAAAIHEVARDLGARQPISILVNNAGWVRSEDFGQNSMQQARNRPPELMAKIIKTYPVGRVGRPRDIGSAVAFLASDEAAFITGQTLTANGGFSTT